MLVLVRYILDTLDMDNRKVEVDRAIGIKALEIGDDGGGGGQEVHE